MPNVRPLPGATALDSEASVFQSSNVDDGRELFAAGLDDVEAHGEPTDTQQISIIFVGDGKKVNYKNLQFVVHRGPDGKLF